MFHDKDNGPWHTVFNLCANLLHWLASKLDPVWPGGMDYVKINVILFCIILPIILIASFALVFLSLWFARLGRTDTSLVSR